MAQRNVGTAYTLFPSFPFHPFIYLFYVERVSLRPTLCICSDRPPPTPRVPRPIDRRQTDAVPTVTGLNRSDNVALRPQSVRKRVKKIGRTGRAEARSVRKWTPVVEITTGSIITPGVSQHPPCFLKVVASLFMGGGMVMYIYCSGANRD